MISPATCLLYTQDPDLVRRTRAFLRNRASVRHLDSPERLEAVLQQNSPAFLMLDLRCHETTRSARAGKDRVAGCFDYCLGSTAVRTAARCRAGRHLRCRGRRFRTASLPGADRSGARTFARPGGQSRFARGNIQRVEERRAARMAAKS